MGKPENVLIHEFLLLEKEARNAADLKELSFVICNLTKRVFPFEQMVLWQKTKTGFRVFSISAIANIYHKSPYIHWLEHSFLPWLAPKTTDELHSINASDATEQLSKEWLSYMPSKLLSFSFQALKNHSDSAGVIIFISSPWATSQTTIANELFKHYQHCWQRLLQKEKKSFLDYMALQKRKNLYKVLAGMAFLCLFFIPIQQTVITSAKISPKNPIMISASIPGVINEIHVEPNQHVDKGQILFSLDNITLQNQVEQAQKAKSIAKERYRRAYQHAYTDPESKAELAILRAEVIKAENELNYREDILERSQIRALRSGIIIFSAPKYWLGKPIQIGEQVMLLAEEGQKQLDAEVPQQDMVDISKGNKVKFFPNIDPLHAINAHVNYASYVAHQDPEGELTYHISCYFSDPQQLPRFGSQGSAKIYAGNVSLFFYLFRRPLIFIQSLVGI
jgi:multidrug resistance efflux pump